MTWFLLLIPWIVHGIKFQDKNNWPSQRSKSFNSDWPQYKKAFVRAVLDSSRARFPFHEKNIFQIYYNLRQQQKKINNINF